MPYTLAHPLFAAPLRRLGLPLSALGAGAVAPDLPLWASAVGLPGHLGSEGYFFTHSVTGILTADLVIGLAIWVIWTHLVREPFLDALPSPLRDRVPRVAPLRLWSLAVIGVVLGAITHVGIDEFTHPGRWGARHIPWLAETHAGVLGTSWVQYTAGISGLVGIALWCGVVVLRSPAQYRPVRHRAARRTVQGLVLAGGVVAATDATIVAADSLHRAAFVAATRGVLIVLAGLVVGSAIWVAADRWARSARFGTGSDPDTRG